MERGTKLAGGRVIGLHGMDPLEIHAVMSNLVLKVTIPSLVTLLEMPFQLIQTLGRKDIIGDWERYGPDSGYSHVKISLG